MNHINDDALDMLVDGELTEERRCEVLLGLDGEPNGWRRCAMAFLEAQAWKQGLSNESDQGTSKPIAMTHRRSPFASHMATVMAVAASFVIALFIGFRVQETLRPTNLGVAPVVSFTSSDTTPAPKNVDTRSNKWKTVTLVSNNGPNGKERSIRLPVVEKNKFDLQKTPNAIPPDVLQSFRRTGHDVHQSRQLVPLRMKDGRQLVVPVDEIELRPTKRRIY